MATQSLGTNTKVTATLVHVLVSWFYIPAAPSMVAILLSDPIGEKGKLGEKNGDVTASWPIPVTEIKTELPITGEVEGRNQRQEA